MKFSLPSTAKDAGPTKKGNAMPPATATKTGMGGGGPTMTSAGTYATFKGSPAGHSCKSLQAPPGGMKPMAK